jgi:hypothetical protein
MDPDVCLAEIRLILDDHASGEWVDLDRLTHLINSMDEWISSGGFLPQAWRDAHAPLTN